MTDNRGATIMGHRQEELEDLRALLAALPSFSDAMTLGELDGFLTGVCLCPTSIPVSDWIRLFWGESETATGVSPIASKALSEAVRRHHSRIESLLRNAPGLFEAVLQEDPQTGEVLWEDWVQGFDTGMSLWRPHWRRPAQENRPLAAPALRVLAKLYLVSIGEAVLDEDYSVNEAEKIPNLIEEIVRSIASRASSRELLLRAQ